MSGNEENGAEENENLYMESSKQSDMDLSDVSSGQSDVDLSDVSSEQSDVDLSDVSSGQSDVNIVSNEDLDMDVSNEHSDVIVSDDEELTSCNKDDILSSSSDDDSHSYNYNFLSLYARLDNTAFMFMFNIYAPHGIIKKECAQKVIDTYVIVTEDGVLQVNDTVDGTFCALYAACVLNNFELVKLFVEYGINVNVLNHCKLSPLHTLLNMREVDTNIVDYLIDHGADLTLKDSASRTPLYVAVKNRHVSAVKSILQQPCDVNASCDSNGATALMAAASIGCLEMFNMLLANGADPNVSFLNGTGLAIHFSLNSCNKEIFKRLLKLTDINLIRKCAFPMAGQIICKKSIDCLNILSESVHREELLVKQKFNLLETAFPYKFYTRYTKICLIGFVFLENVVSDPQIHKQIFDTLIKNGVSVNQLSEECVPPLSAAAHSFSSKDCTATSYIEALLQHGADVNFPQTDAPEALLCSLKNYDVTLLLLRHADFATPDTVLKAYLKVGNVSCISPKVIELFLTLGMTRSGVKLLDSYHYTELLHKNYTEYIHNYNMLTSDVCTLQQLCRISVRQLFYSKYKNLSINEIMKMICLPASVWKYLRYKTD